MIRTSALRSALGVLVVLFGIQSPLRAQRLLADGTKDLADQIVASSADAQKRRIAVLSFRDLSGRPTVLGAYLAQSLTTRLFGAKGLEIVERAMLDKVVAEMKLSASGAIDPATAARIGKLVGVDAIVTGSVTDLQSSVAVNCRLIDVATARVFAAAETRIAKDDDLRAILNQPLELESAGESRSAEAATRPGLLKASGGGFDFVLEKCSRSGGEVLFVLTVSNTRDDMYLNIRTVEVFDDGGNASRTSGPGEIRITLANTSGTNWAGAQAMMVSGIKTRASIAAGVGPQAKSLSVVNLSCYTSAPRGGGIGSGMANRGNTEFKVQFRDIPISR